MSYNCTTNNPALFPKLKRSPDRRMIGKRYLYMPNMMHKIDEIPNGSTVQIVDTPKDGDVLCKVTYRDKDYNVFWEDLVKI